MKNTYLESKPRYEILDGLRGVAALMVVAFHLFETYSGGHFTQIINHGYLAVDFFFVLSGFVIGYAYDDRWSKMSLGDFVKRRLVRLHPMLIFGALVGGLLFYFSECSAFPNITQVAWWKVLLSTLACALLIPLPARFDIRGWAEGYPMNGPAWSLAWEYVANISYALVIRRFGKRLLMVCVGLFAVLTVLLCLNIDLFGLLEPRSWAAYTVIGGWSLDPDQLYVGISRLLYPFFAGLLLSRLGWKIRMKGGFGWASLWVMLLLAMPYVGTEQSQWMNGLYEALCILIFFPLIVLVGAGSNIKGGPTSALCKFLGEISYPIYITHYPLIYIQMAWAERHASAPLSSHLFVGVSLFVLSIVVAYASLKLYDLPLREWLKEQVLKHKKQNRL